MLTIADQKKLRQVVPTAVRPGEASNLNVGTSHHVTTTYVVSIGKILAFIDPSLQVMVTSQRSPFS